MKWNWFESNKTSTTINYVRTNHKREKKNYFFSIDEELLFFNSAV